MFLLLLSFVTSLSAFLIACLGPRIINTQDTLAIPRYYHSQSGLSETFTFQALRNPRLLSCRDLSLHNTGNRFTATAPPMPRVQGAFEVKMVAIIGGPSCPVLRIKGVLGAAV